jgi:hypothetical protein
MNTNETFEKCAINFKTQYAYINDKRIHINDYIKQNIDKLLCSNGHELIMCKGKIRIPYFRHKNSEDMGGTPMSEWHSRMQSYFPITEVKFPKCDTQIKERRADVVIEGHNFIVEIQHSKIDDSNVICRTKDYSLHNMKLIWLVDGNTDDVILEKLSTDNFLITFLNDWKYKSFKHNYDYILLDINDKIFKIPVKKVCNKMILVKEFKNIDYVINILNNNPTNIWNEWLDDNEIKATLRVQQKGAGNGKTFGIWKNISMNKDKELFIIVTKQHSAKSVIYRELNEQSIRNEYHIIENIGDYDEEEKNRKYIIKYKHNHSKRECIVIIGTIDSLIFILCNNEYNNSNFFEGLLNTIEEYGVTKVNKSNGSIRYAGKEIKLNKKTELWIDEAQDLPILYFNAVIKLMLQTKIDVVIVGDKLQSLEYKINFMTCVDDDIPNINIIKENSINKNRRIKVNTMANKINELIHFSDYNLPIINVSNENKLTNINSSLEILNEPVIYAGVNSVENRDKIKKYIDLILEKVKFEANTYNYNPEDFLFIFPIMKENNLAGELETRLNEYWIQKLDEEDIYKQYAVLHRHEEGQVIDISLSDKASRIVTIRTSKGDGRSVVFVLGCTETSLKMVSKCDTSKDLIFESYLHVALTRAKNKIYFGLQKNNDIIHQRFANEGLVEFKPIIKTSINNDKIIQNVDKNRMVELLKKNGINEPQKIDNKNKDKDKQIDWNYHCIRRAIYLQYAIFNIFKENKNNNNFKSSQLKIVLDKITDLNIKSYAPQKFYNYINNVDDFSKGTDKLPSYLPFCNLSHKPKYKTITRKFRNYIINNSKNYKKDNLSIENQRPIEAIIQWYCIELFTRRKYCETTPSTIYNIINHFENEEETKLTQLMKESKIIKDTTKRAIRSILDNDKHVNWNIEHMIKFDGKCSGFKLLYKNIPIIGWSKSFIYHIVFQTDFNQLNFWDTLIKIIVERFILYNVGDKGKDVNKFKNKTIKTFLFILKKNDYEEFNWKWDEVTEFNIEIKYLCKSAIVKHFSSFNRSLYQYCTYVKKTQIWKEGNYFKSPYDYIANVYSEEQNVIHVRDFFKNLHDISKSEAKNITYDYELFSIKLTEKIEEMCDSFFGLNQPIESSDDEW